MSFVLSFVLLVEPATNDARNLGLDRHNVGNEHGDHIVAIRVVVPLERLNVVARIIDLIFSKRQIDFSALLIELVLVFLLLLQMELLALGHSRIFDRIESRLPSQVKFVHLLGFLGGADHIVDQLLGLHQLDNTIRNFGLCHVYKK